MRIILFLYTLFFRKGTNDIAKRFLKKMLHGQKLSKGQGYVSCDGSGSCREYVQYVSGKEGGEEEVVSGAGGSLEL